MKAVKYSFFAFLALVFISLVLRPPVAAIGPLVDELTKSESLSLFQVGLLVVDYFYGLLEIIYK